MKHTKETAIAYARTMSNNNPEIKYVIGYKGSKYFVVTMGEYVKNMKMGNIYTAFKNGSDCGM